MNLANVFDRVVVISLKRRSERLKAFYEALDAVSWPFLRPTVFEAIDGFSFEIDPPSTWEKPLGAWGCRLSHLAVLCQAIQDNVKHILIMEDDCCFHSTFRKDVEMFFDELKSYLYDFRESSNQPYPYDGLCLGGQNVQRPFWNNGRVSRVTDCQRTHAYSARPNYQKALHELWTKDVVTHIDRLVTQVQKNHLIYAPSKFLIGQDEASSDIGDRGNRSGRRNFWNEPGPLSPVILFRGPREVLEGMRQHGWHPGYEMDRDTGIEVDLIKAFRMGWVGLGSWLEYLQWEAAQIENGIVVVYHPQVTLDVCQGASRGPVYEIKADSLEGALHAYRNGKARSMGGYAR